MPSFEPGPIARLDVDAVLAGDLQYDFAAHATAELSGVDAADARIGRNVETMQGDLAAHDPTSLDGAIAAADQAHQAVHEDAFAPSTEELTAAAAERVRLEAVAAVLPADGVVSAVPQLQSVESRLEPVSIDYDALAGLPGYVDRALADIRRRLEELGKIPVGFTPGPRPSPGPPPEPTEKPPGPSPHPPVDLPPPIEDNPDAHGKIHPPSDDGSGDNTTPSGGAESPLAGKLPEE